MYETRNQALTMCTDFFDPIHSSARLKMDPANSDPISVYFRTEKPCVTVSDDRTVEFSFEHCKGESVAVSGFGGNFPEKKIELKNDGKGNFSVKVPHFPPGLHYYHWYVDGVEVVHANAGVHFGCFQALNMFEVPEEGVDFYYIKPVEHGRIHMCKYVSSINAHRKQCYVYTPPGYEKENNQVYPVLYLQHGIGGNETSWVWLGKLNFILDNLIAEDQCEKMIVVMSSGYSFHDHPGEQILPADFREELMQDIIPLVEGSFRTVRNGSGRAIAGIAIGAEQSILAVNKYPKAFCALGVISGFAENIQLNLGEKLQIFVGCGDSEDTILKQQLAFLKTVQEKCRKKESGLENMKLSHKTYEGFHEWHVFRKILCDFLKEIFHETDASLEEQDDTIIKHRRNHKTFQKAEMDCNEDSAVFYDPIYKRVLNHIDEVGTKLKKCADARKGIDVLSDGSVHLSFYAPGAEYVMAEVFGKEKRVLYPDKNAEGYFTDVISDVSEGIHYIQFYINGVEVVNPDAPVSFGCYRTMNFVEIPEKKYAYMDQLKMAHGHVSMNYYRSKETGREKLCYIYTPAEYDQNVDKRYPVLYLQHGSGENELGWLHQGNLAKIADALIETKKMEPMIIVMNSGYSIYENDEMHETYARFAREMIYDCIPYVDQTYKTLPKGEYRAIAGISMGGIQAQYVAFEYPDMIKWLASFSGGIKIPSVISHLPDEEKEIYERLYKAHKLIFLACATNDHFYEETVCMAENAKRAGYKIATFFDEGEHDWTFWRHALIALLEKLWREEIC